MKKARELKEEISEDIQKSDCCKEDEVRDGQGKQPIIIQLTPEQFREAMRIHAIAEAVPADGALEPKPGSSPERAECLGENASNQQSEREDDLNRSPHLQKAAQVVRAVLDNGGEFIRSGDRVYILTGGKRILVSPDFNNHAYARIQIKFAGVGTAEHKGRAICQYVAVLGSQEAANMRLAKFSALSKDRTRIYVPIEGGDLLEITAQGLNRVPNGANADSLWLEHPQEKPLKYLPDCNVREVLVDFERLCVETQACAPASRWLVAMHEGLMPYVRDCVSARMLVEHTGPSQHGKTSGAQRFTILHGLGEVLGDVSTAYLRNNCDGMGLMVLDNKEQANYGQDLISLLLFTATGARYGRSTQDGSAREMSDRPIGVLTSIEGLYRQELQKRTICIPYGGALQEAHRDRDYIEEQIELRRDLMVSGLCHVLCKFLSMKPEQVDERLRKLPSKNPWPEFQGYVRVLARLLYAYATLRGSPLTWADEIISGWFNTLGAASVEHEDDVIEMHVQQALELYEAIRAKKESFVEVSPASEMLFSAIQRAADYPHKGKLGTLYITSAARLLSAMRSNNIGIKDLPKNAIGMGKRLESGGWAMLQVVKEDDDKQLLRRTSGQRKIGIFRPEEISQDEGSEGDTELGELPIVDESPLEGELPA
jgi:hypothetical protein